MTVGASRDRGGASGEAGGGYLAERRRAALSQLARPASRFHMRLDVCSLGKRGVAVAADGATVFSILSDEDPGATSLLGIARLVEAGLPLAALDRVVRAVAPDDAGFVASIVPKATLSRRRSGASGTLSAEESNKVARLAKVWAMAMRVWDDEDDARAFLGRPHPMLEGRKPREVAVGSDPGADAVINIMGRGAYGGGV